MASLVCVPQDTACPTGQTWGCPRSNIWSNICPSAGFAAGSAAAPVLRRELEATSALPQQLQDETAPSDIEEVDLETKPPDPGHGSTQEAKSHQAASAEEKD